MISTWGLLGPEFLPNMRRTRTLGLGASVRLFNDLAVPGLGGVWYGKQLFLASLGIVVAEAVRTEGVKVQNIEVANAIEALACFLAFKNNNWNSDARLRGNTKLKNVGNDFSFSNARQSSFYVTQPMRMATVQSLPALGFVDSDSVRFNAFRISEAGRMFVDQACKNFSPYKNSVVNHLAMWVCGRHSSLSSPKLQLALSPIEPLSIDAVSLLNERLLQGGLYESPEERTRRKNALSWVEAVRLSKPDNLNWDVQPKEITNDHWHDLKAGKLFFQTRQAAIAVLDALESHMGNQNKGQTYSLLTKVPEEVFPLLEELKKVAKTFLETNHPDLEAKSFCRECERDDGVLVLRSLVARDGNVLRLLGDEVKPGPAFRGSVDIQEESDEITVETVVSGNDPLPAGISYRMRNLFLLNIDMHKELSTYLNPPTVEVLN